ncbi:hypothetical protein [Dictyobacter kobayashii]|uniref:Uncharacterized protein n=1 Tax=Dictyobacter kobayashii TaxID=2014872 RepID=A0A402APA8_9CHLR|nr:hypothetical protein [Dictyobacter kobayashii]GCE20946.1 hypothetical protein KDK_47460 [Dictyobacter kobayashii]
MKAEHQEIIDQTLLDITGRENERTSAVGAVARNDLSIEELRQSILGQWLRQLIDVAENGPGTTTPADARAMLENVYKILFQAPGQSYPLIPPKFDKTPLGVLLNAVRIYTLGLNDIVSVAEAARLTQIQRAQIYYLIFGACYTQSKSMAKS